MKVILPLVFILLLACTKEPETENKVFQLNKVVKGGCNLATPDLKSTNAIFEEDFVTFKEQNDTLYTEVGINYLCCALFDTDFIYRIDSLLFFVNDICTDDDHCYCHCMCFYEFDFVFDQYPKGQHTYKVYLYGRDGLHTIKEGIICF